MFWKYITEQKTLLKTPYTTLDCSEKYTNYVYNNLKIYLTIVRCYNKYNEALAHKGTDL